MLAAGTNGKMQVRIRTQTQRTYASAYKPSIEICSHTSHGKTVAAADVAVALGWLENEVDALLGSTQWDVNAYLYVLWMCIRYKRERKNRFQRGSLGSTENAHIKRYYSFVRGSQLLLQCSVQTVPCCAGRHVIV